MKKVRIEQKLNLASQKALAASPKGHSQMTIVAEVDTDDERLLEILDKTTFQFVLPDAYWDANHINNRVVKGHCNVIGEPILMAYHTPVITIQEAS